MKRVWVIVIIVAVLAGAGYGGYRYYTQAQAAPQFEVVRQASVEKGTLAATVSASGTLEPEALVSLSFGGPGTVTTVNVARGQTVRAGDVLASLNAAELELLVQQAQDALDIQALTLEQARSETPSAATLAAAQADIDAAQANLSIAQANLASARAGVAQAQAAKAQLQAGPTSAEIAAAQADIAAQTANVKSQQDNYDIRIIQPGIGGWVEENARYQLEAARQALAAAEARLAVLQAGPRPADLQAADAGIAGAQAAVLSAEGSIAVAQANVARAQAAYDRLQERPGDIQLQILAAQVAAAQTSLDLATLRLKNSLIVAPIDGVVASLLVTEGEQAIVGAPAITLLNEGAYHIDLSVDEIDIERVTVGQTVEVTLDAIPDVTLSGQVADIAPTATDLIGGVVTYQVTVNLLDNGGLDLRPGLTANVSIVVQEVADALIAPNWAIRVNRDTGEAFVNRLTPDNQVEEVVITTGVRNEQYSQVLSGLAEGDIVAITNQRETFSFLGGGN